MGVATGDSNNVVSNANFSGAYTYEYGNIKFDADELKKLGVAPAITFATGENSYFNMSGLKCDFVLGKVQELEGGIGEQIVTIAAKDSTGTYSATLTVKVKDNTDVPYTVVRPSYKATETLEIDGSDETITYRYRVGNASPIALDRLFKLKDGKTAGDYSIFIFNSEPYDRGYFSNATKVDEFKLSEVTALDFSDSAKYTASNDQTYYLVIGVKELDANGTLKVYAPDDTYVVQITLIANGVNVNTVADFKTPTSGQSLVIHDNITTEYTETVVKIANAGIYGNYYTITADNFTDTDVSDGYYSFIALSGGTAANPTTINQLVIEGPVYKNPAMSADNVGIPETSLGSNPSDNFCNGINVDGGYTVINDSYIYGFNSNVRINKSASFEANGTTFEGGAWSNIFIANATKFRLVDCTTYQKRGGYESNMPGANGEVVLGMGIYVHETLSSDLRIELKNTKQYNWLAESDTDKGFFLKLAVEEMFNPTSVAATLGFYHTVENTKYVNCTVASLGVDLRAFTWFSDSSLMKVNAVTNFVVVNDGYSYIGSTTPTATKVEIVNVLGNGAYANVTGNVHSYKCEAQTDCNCDEEVAFTFSISKFRATKINTNE